jgi:Zn-dependent protease
MQGLEMLVNSALMVGYGVFLHELGHVMAAELLGLKVKRMCFHWPLGVGFERSAGTPGENCAVALAGPLMNLLLAWCFWEQPLIAHGNLGFALINLCLPHSDGWKAAQYLRSYKFTVQSSQRVKA